MCIWAENWYIHNVYLSWNWYIHYVQISTSFQLLASFKGIARENGKIGFLSYVYTLPYIWKFWTHIGHTHPPQHSSTSVLSVVCDSSSVWLGWDAIWQIPVESQHLYSILCWRFPVASKIECRLQKVEVSCQFAKIIIKTSQELQMLSSVTLHCQVTKIILNAGSQLSEL